MLQNPERVKNEVVLWIRHFFNHNAPNASAVIGISGGKDSSVAASLCAEALGKERVIGVTMPDGQQPDMPMRRIFWIPLNWLEYARIFV